MICNERSEIQQERSGVGSTRIEDVEVCVFFPLDITCYCSNERLCVV